MKPEELDSLLVDRAAGELTPEVAALLDEHLLRDAAAARRAADFAATMQLARAAVSVRAREALPPLRALASASVRGPRRLRVLGGEWLRLAAAIVVGLSAGTGIGVKLSAPDRAPVAVAASAGATEAAPAGRFWSASRRTAELLQPAVRRAGGATSLSNLRGLPARANSIAEDKP